MGISPSELASRFPLLYHMAEIGSWPSIARHGLLSTSALLDFYEVSGRRRTALESEHRRESVRVEHATHGRAIVRDQKPMSDSDLRKCLQDGLSPEDWYRILNDKVFFWLTENRLERLLSARAYRNTRHTVLIVDSASLLEKHAHRITLSPINSGATKPRPQPRGRDTFLPLTEYPFAEWDRKRRRRDPIVELAVAYSVPDVREFVVRVEHRGGDRSANEVWVRCQNSPDEFQPVEGSDR